MNWLAVGIPVIEQLPPGTGACGQPAGDPKPSYGYATPSGCEADRVQTLYAVGAAKPATQVYFWNTLNKPPTCDTAKLQVPGVYELTPIDPSALPALTVGVE